MKENGALQDMLVELALTLVPRGMTPRKFGELSRYAFARAAAAISQPASDKINHSRVAALTGLSRADVKRLLRSDEATLAAEHRHQVPIVRVMNGWREDRRFVDRHGNPRNLKISGGPSSFVMLTKIYGGDVPHRAILEELRRIGAVRRDGHHVVLTLTQAQRQSRRLPSLAVLPVVTGLLVENRKKEPDPPRRRPARLKAS